MEIKASELLSYLGSLIGLLTVAQTMLHSLLATPMMGVVAALVCRARDVLSRFHYVEVPEYDESCLPNELYGAIKLHLSASITAASAHSTAKRLKLFRTATSSEFTWSPGHHELVPITFSGARVFWEHYTSQEPTSPPHSMHSTLWNRPSLPDEKRSYILKLHKKHKSRVLTPYMEHILKQARDIRHHNRERLLYTNGRNDSFRHPWDSVPFKHPSTFGTLALDPLKKRSIEEDLHAFAQGEEFYKRTGRAWKRGYLLYGPPGTGKSSLIAAMANLLRYDVYDLELTQVRSNAELRKLLLRTTSKSIIVIEDIDCSLELGSRAGISTKQGRAARRPLIADSQRACFGSYSPGCIENRGGMDDYALMQGGGSSMTLSGLLNFTDGLWSCCGDERIFVFTTNHIESLDPALLRSGRMDMHIFMSYCTFAAFKILAFNYLGFDDHPLFRNVEEEMERAHMTPAEVSEILIRNRDKPCMAIEELLCKLESEAKAACNKPPSVMVLEKEELESSKPWGTCNNVVVKEELYVHSMEEEVEQVKRAVLDNKEVLGDLGCDVQDMSSMRLKSIKCPNCQESISNQEGFNSFEDDDPENLLPYPPILAPKKLQKSD